MLYELVSFVLSGYHVNIPSEYEAYILLLFLSNDEDEEE